MTTEADLAEFNNGIRRARYAYALRTGDIKRPTRPCLACGKPTLADSQVHGECERRGDAR